MKQLLSGCAAIRHAVYRLDSSWLLLYIQPCMVQKNKNKCIYK